MINNLENVFCRIDVIEIFMYGDKYRINYIKNCMYEKPYNRFIK